MVYLICANLNSGLTGTTPHYRQVHANWNRCCLPNGSVTASMFAFARQQQQKQQHTTAVKRRPCMRRTSYGAGNSEPSVGCMRRMSCGVAAQQTNWMLRTWSCRISIVSRSRMKHIVVFGRGAAAFGIRFGCVLDSRNQHSVDWLHIVTCQSCLPVLTAIKGTRPLHDKT